MKKTLAKVKARFYWPGLTADVRSNLRKCNLCERRKSPPKKRQAPLHYSIGWEYPLKGSQLTYLAHYLLTRLHNSEMRSDNILFFFYSSRHDRDTSIEYSVCS